VTDAQINAGTPFDRDLDELLTDFETGLRECQRLLDRLGERDALGPPDFERGLCGECGRLAWRRWTHGRFGKREGETISVRIGEGYDEATFCRLPICRTCRGRRLEVASRLERMDIRQEPLPAPPQPQAEEVAA